VFWRAATFHRLYACPIVDVPFYEIGTPGGLERLERYLA
jgi:hypothetical protein